MLLLAVSGKNGTRQQGKIGKSGTVSVRCLVQSLRLEFKGWGFEFEFGVWEN